MANVKNIDFNDSAFAGVEIKPIEENFEEELFTDPVNHNALLFSKKRYEYNHSNVRFGYHLTVEGGECSGETSFTVCATLDFDSMSNQAKGDVRDNFDLKPQAEAGLYECYNSGYGFELGKFSGKPEEFLADLQRICAITAHIGESNIDEYLNASWNDDLKSRAVIMSQWVNY